MDREKCKVLACPFCDHSSHSPKQLRAHVRSSHPKVKSPYKCPNCEFSSERLHILVVHKADKHGPDAKELGCDTKEIENDPVVANNAAENRDGDEEMKYSELCCPVQDCGFVGKSKSKLDLHAKMHGRRHSCKECEVSKGHSCHSIIYSKRNIIETQNANGTHHEFQNAPMSATPQ